MIGKLSDLLIKNETPALRARASVLWVQSSPQHDTKQHRWHELSITPNNSGQHRGVTYNINMRNKGRWVTALSLLIFTFFLFPSIPSSAMAITLLWQYQGNREWAEHPIIKNGIVYVPWTNGSLTAHSLSSGVLLHSVDQVNDATAPFIVGDKIYSFNETGMSEIDLSSFAILRKIPLPEAIYTENIPYDVDTGYFFIREGQAFLYKGRVSAYRLSDVVLPSTA